MAAKKKTTTPSVDVEKLLETGAHFGHMNKRWNPKMEPYLYGVRDGVHIFDLIQTESLLGEALKKLADAKKSGKTILLVGTKKQVKDKIREIGQERLVPYVDERWLGGTITNFGQIRSSVEHMKELKEKMEKGEFSDRTKKERLDIARKIEKLESSVGGISELENLPDLMFIVDTHREHAALREAHLAGIEIIGIVDSNADPDMVTHVIPMNDDSPKALDYVLDLVGEALK